MADPTPSRLDDYLDVFVAPSRLFERRSDGKFGQALLVFVILLAVLVFSTRTAMQPIMDAEWDRGMAAAAQKNPSLTPEQLAAGKSFMGAAAGVFVIVGFPIAILVLGAAIWVIARVIGRSLTYSQGATIATFAMFPRLIDSVVGAVQALLLNETALTSRYAVSLGIGRFLDPATTNHYLLAVLGRVDLFTLWVTALVAIGLRVMAKATLGETVAGAVIVWFVGAILPLLQALNS